MLVRPWRSICFSFLLVATSGCQTDENLPPLQVEGEILSYASDEPVCEGTVEYGERWMIAVAMRLGIAEDELLPTTYYRLSLEDANERCGGQGCARMSGGGVRIFHPWILNEHELVHAIHLSAWPRRRDVLDEGLAVVFDDSHFHHYNYNGLAGLDVDTLLEATETEEDTYFVGSWIVYWTIQRHGLDAFREFWHADSPEGGSAEEFRALFEDHFGESLDSMLAAVEGQYASPLPTCIGDVVPWQGDAWAIESPKSCDDGLARGSADGSELMRAVLVEIPTAGTYTVSVSDSSRHQGAHLEPCEVPSRIAGSYSHFSGQSREVVLDAGLHRVTTYKLDIDDPGIRVEIQPN